MTDWSELYQTKQDWRIFGGELAVLHFQIWRRDGEEIRMTWSELQAIKNEMCGEDAALIEVFPAESNVVNEVNRRHFWGYPVPLFMKAVK